MGVKTVSEKHIQLLCSQHSNARAANIICSCDKACTSAILSRLSRLQYSKFTRTSREQSAGSMSCEAQFDAWHMV